MRRRLARLGKLGTLEATVSLERPLLEFARTDVVRRVRKT